MNKKERAILGRKRLDQTKSRVKLSIDADLLQRLKDEDVNISQLLRIAAKKYFRLKRKK